MDNNKVTFWGTRGSMVQTSRDMVKYGLETTCISLETENEIFLIDCGSGIRGFDKYLSNNNNKNKKINILLSHYHHDHIIGLAFANFIYNKDLEIEIFGLGNVYQTLKDYFGPPYFPISIVDLPNIKTTSLTSFEKISFGEIEVQTTELFHPQMCVGYKFLLNDKTITFIFDYEHKVDEFNRDKVEQFLNNSDFLIIDAFSTEEDYISGWGHNSIEDVIELVEKSNIGKCYLTHHNINYNDEKMNKIQESISMNYDNIVIAEEKTSFII